LLLWVAEEPLDCMGLCTGEEFLGFGEVRMHHWRVGVRVNFKVRAEDGRLRVAAIDQSRNGHSAHVIT
jgi:hypothetical protein